MGMRYRRGDLETVLLGLITLVIVLGTLALPFLAFDFSTGTNTGKLTAVDGSFWGTYTVYLNDGQISTGSDGKVKSGYNYCVEDKTMADALKKEVGKTIQVWYDEPRV